MSKLSLILKILLFLFLTTISHENYDFFRVSWALQTWVLALYPSYWEARQLEILLNYVESLKLSHVIF